MDITRPVAIIPCGQDKLDAPAPAADLYCGDMFRMSIAAARSIAEGDDAQVLVLSALHGLVQLDQVIAPYDLRMGAPGSVTAETVAAQALALGIDWGADVYALLPSAYFEVLDAALRTLDVYPADVFEADAGIGFQRRTCRFVRDPFPVPA